MCCSCWRRCCCCCTSRPKTVHEDPPAREVKPRQSGKKVQAPTGSHDTSRRGGAGDVDSGKRPTSPLPPMGPTQATQVAPIPPIINWIMAGQPRTRKNSTSGTATFGRRSTPRGIINGRGLETHRRSPYVKDAISIFSPMEDTSSVGEASGQRRIVSRSEHTPPPPSATEPALGDDLPTGPLEVPHSNELVPSPLHLDISGGEKYANDLPKQLGTESPKIVSSELGDSPSPSTAPRPLLVQDGTPADDTGSMSLPLGGGENAARPRNMDKIRGKNVSHKKPVFAQGKQLYPSRTSQETDPARSSIDDHAKPKHQGTFPLLQAPVRSSSRKGPSIDDISQASPSSRDASNEERLDSGRHGSRKGRNKHALQQYLDQGSKKTLQQAGHAMPQMAASNTSFAARSTTRTPQPDISTPNKYRLPRQTVSRGLSRGDVPGEKRTDPAQRVINNRKTPSQGHPSAPRTAPGAIAPEEDPPTHHSKAKLSTMQESLFSSSKSPGKLHQGGSVTTADNYRQQAFAASGKRIFKAESSVSRSVSGITPSSNLKPRINANKDIIPANLPAQTPLTVLSSASKPNARFVSSHASQPPASTARRRTISLPRSNPVEISGPVRRREYYLLDENLDNWLSPSMELYEIADFVYGYLTEYISFMGLGGFYPRGSSYLHELSAKAAAMVKRVKGHAIEEIADHFVHNVTEGVAEYPTGDETGNVGGDVAGDSTIVLDTPNDIIDMIKVALYDVVIYCDDSGSMNAEGGGRIEGLKELVRSVTKITSTFDTDGIKVRFINFAADGGFNNLHTVGEVNQVLDAVNFNGGTRIGTGLEHKILNPLLFDKLRVGTLKRPLLVTTITDGSPYGEDESHFKNMIVKCKETLREEGFQPTSVVFQVSQVGSAADGEHFINVLHSDSQVGEMVYCTAEKLDTKIAELHDNRRNLERWLLDLLLQGL